MPIWQLWKTAMALISCHWQRSHLEQYGNDSCEAFLPILLKDTKIDEKTMQLTAKMHKAISVIQLKEEARIFHRSSRVGYGEPLSVGGCRR
jgi:Uncharacterized protein conserved in bacteria